MQKIHSLYMHFPFCFHLCNYCDFYKRKIDSTEDGVANYELLLERQWQEHIQLLATHNFSLGKLKTFYLGGGTPSLWAARGSKFLSDKVINNWFDFDSSYEFTLEVDPNAFNENDLALWRDIGVNRISIGAQAYDDKYLKILDRKHSKHEIQMTVEKCQKYFKNISVDFILGTPQSEERKLEQELTELLQLGPQHMSIYMLNTRANYPHKKTLPPDDQVANEYEKMVSILDKAGLYQYEVSNFAKPHFKSQHNLEYWHCNSVAAIGPSATGLLVSENHLATRYKWKVMGPDAQVENLTPEQFLIEYVYMHLRSEIGLDLHALFHERKSELDPLISNWNRLGYLKNGSACTKVQLNFKGYLMLDSIIGDLFTLGLL